MLRTLLRLLACLSRRSYRVAGRTAPIKGAIDKVAQTRDWLQLNVMDRIVEISDGPCDEIAERPLGLPLYGRNSGDNHLVGEAMFHAASKILFFIFRPSSLAVIAIAAGLF